MTGHLLSCPEVEKFRTFRNQENGSGRASCDGLIKWCATPLNAGWPPFFPERYTYNPIENYLRNRFSRPGGHRRSALLCKENIKWKGNKFNYQAAQRFRPEAHFHPQMQLPPLPIKKYTWDKSSINFVKVSQRTSPYSIQHLRGNTQDVAVAVVQLLIASPWTEASCFGKNCRRSYNTC